MTPQQVMVRATSAADPLAQAFFLARSVVDGPEGARAASLTAAGLAKQMGPLGGRVALALLLGDAAVAEPVHWDFAEVSYQGL